MASLESQASVPVAAVIGAGPAGLMAAEMLARAGHAVEVFDAMPSVARKFLLAGVGGMNITHAEDYATFVSRYGASQHCLKPIIDEFPPERLRAWIHQLGIETFVGTSERVFPRDMKAAPLLRAWLHRLRELGVQFHPRTRWLGWPENRPELGWCFESPEGAQQHRFDAVVLALGGASWPRIGSDGRWTELLKRAGIAVQPLQPSNCGFHVNWSDHLRERFTGTPLKNVALRLASRSGEVLYRKGELSITDYGIEGSLVYAFSGALRDSLRGDGSGDSGTGQNTAAQDQQDLASARLTLDWLPDRSEDWIRNQLANGKPDASFANRLRKQLRLPPIASALLRDCWPDLDRHNPAAVGAALKAMPLAVKAPRPIEEAISTAGGVCFDAVDDRLMLKSLPGVFVAGEMLDWEAPTGGYLLTACFATGRRAGLGAARWLESRHSR